jgi:hypothetical protein
VVVSGGFLDEGEREGKAYPDTASLSTVAFKLMSINVCATNAPFCGLFPFVVSSSALMLLLFAFVKSIAITTSEGRLNCESVSQYVNTIHAIKRRQHTKCAGSMT